MAVVKRGISAEDIIRGCEGYAAYVIREGRDPNFIAQAVTWLNQERWTDDHKPLEPAQREIGPI